MLFNSSVSKSLKLLIGCGVRSVRIQSGTWGKSSEIHWHRVGADDNPPPPAPPVADSDVTVSSHQSVSVLKTSWHLRPHGGLWVSVTPGNTWHVRGSGDIFMATSAAVGSCCPVFPLQGKQRVGVLWSSEEERHCGAAVWLAMAKFCCSTTRELRSCEEKKNRLSSYNKDMMDSCWLQNKRKSCTSVLSEGESLPSTGFPLFVCLTAGIRKTKVFLQTWRNSNTFIIIPPQKNPIDHQGYTQHLFSM